jgi:hypothetical protein
MNRAFRAASLVLFACFLSFVGGCASDVTVNETLRRPAEINMAGLEKVRLDGIEGAGGEMMLARLKPALAQSQFDVLDRGSGAASMQEDTLKKLSVTGADQQAGAGVIAADASINGKVLRHDLVNEGVRQGEIIVNGVRYPAYGRVGCAYVDVSMEVVDLRTRRLIATKYIRVARRAETPLATGAAPALPDQEMFDACYNQVVSRFMKMIAPYTEIIPVKLAKVKDVPQNDTGIAQFQAKNYDLAAKQFYEALGAAKTLPKIKPRDLAGINHNLGIACEFGGHWPEALAWYQQAIALYPDGQYTQSINRCKQRETDRQELANQGK